MAYKSYVDEMESNTHIDAEWKRIQEKTFTRWCNEQLKDAGVILTDLSVDLCDGVNLIVLLEFLSQKKLGRYNKKPKIHAQRMENVEKSLNFITKDERIRLVNIGSGDIVGGNLKLILGLIWTLIFHYQIKLGLGLGGDDANKKTVKEISAKKALLEYFQKKVPHKDIKDFTTSWKDGTTVAALVDAIAPGLCPEAELMDPKDALANAQHAMKLAQDWLKVPMLLGPEDMVNPNVDELSMMTYLSQFPDAELQPGAPIKPKRDPTKIIVAGPGVEGEGLKTGLPAVFYVDTKDAGTGRLEAIVEGPDGPVEVHKEDNKDGSYNCSYVPVTEGAYEIDIKWSNKPIRELPYRVIVSPGTNAMACRAYGPGVEGTDLKEGTLTQFNVETTGAGEGDLNIAVRGPKGQLDTVNMQQDQEQETLHHVNYIPPSPGQYTVEVTYAGLHIKDSPFKVRVVADKPDASKCYAQGPGVESNELLVDQETWFTVHTKGAGRGELVANTRGPHGELPMTITTDLDEEMTKFVYTPRESGELVITIKYGGTQIPGSRFRVEALPPPKPDKCIARGPGLASEGIQVNKPQYFEVQTKDAGRGDVDVSIIGPGGPLEFKTQYWLHKYDYTYQTKLPGMYTIDIKFADQNVPGSPFAVPITDASKVKISGHGTKGEPVLVNAPLKFDVSSEEAGPGKVACHVPETSVKPTVTKLDDDNFEIHYSPSNVGLQKMNVTFNEEPIPSSPLYLVVYDPAKVLAEGPGLENGNKTDEMTYFTVDTSQAGEGHLLLDIKGPVNTKLLTKDQGNNITRCEYMPLIEGNYIIDVLYEGHHISNSPYHVFIKQKANPLLVTASGSGLGGSGLTTDTLAEFVVDYSAAGESEVQVKIEGPGGGVEFVEEPLEAGIVKFSYHTDPDEAGLYVVDIRFADEPIPHSPYKVPVVWKPDASRIIAEGTGLEGGTSNEWAEFTVDLQKSGDGTLQVNIEGPCKPETSCSSVEEGVEKFSYLPELPGTYDISIMFNDSHIPGSPFQPIFELGTDPSKCKVHGPGLREHGVKVGDPGDFVIDTRDAGKGALDVVVNGPQGINQHSAPLIKPIITSNNDGTYNVAYNPRKVGTYSVSVIFADSSVPGSPFIVNITDPSKVLLSGPGCVDSDKDVEVPVESELIWKADTSPAGPGILTAVILRQNGADEILVRNNNKENVYQLVYSPEIPGPSQLVVEYSGNPINFSPNLAVFDASKVYVYGAAFDGVNVNEEARFSIDYSDAGPGQLSLNLVGPKHVKLETVDTEEFGITPFKFVSSVAGIYELSVTFGNIHVAGSPFSIPVRDISKVIVGGSGITGEGVKVNEEAVIVIDTTQSGPADIEVKVTAPSGQREVVSLDKMWEKDNSIYKVFQGVYTPKESGYYGVEIKYNDVELSASPYQVPVGAPDLVKVNGSSKVLYAFVGEDNVIECDTSKAGPGNITAEFTGPSPLESLSYSSTCDGSQAIHYVVNQPGTYQAQILYNQFPVSGEPKTIEAVDLAKVLASGPGLEPGIRAREGTSFNVDTTGTGKGTLKVCVESSNKKSIPVNISTPSNEKIDTYKVEYQPNFAGEYYVSILYNDKEIYCSPICVPVIDPSKVKCSGAGLSHAVVGEPAEFIIDYTEAGEGVVNVSIDDIDEVHCNDNSNGTLTVSYVPYKPGPSNIHVNFSGFPVEGSPFMIKCQRPPPDASKCIISGLNNLGSFAVDCKDAGGTGSLEVGVCGAYVPAKFVSVKHNGDYTFSVTYDIESSDITTISVKWHDQHLNGSPFVVPSIK